MTNNDDFTEAARAEAERWNDWADEQYNRGVESAQGVDEDSFIIGAEWARAHLAAQEPTTADVQALQDCLYEQAHAWLSGVEVRAALSAARNARRDEETDR